MKTKLLVLVFLIQNIGLLSAQSVVYDTTHSQITSIEITPTANGIGCSLGDAVKLGGTDRMITAIDVDLHITTDTSPFTMVMNVYSDCPTNGGASDCGGGIGTLMGSYFKEITPPNIINAVFTTSFDLTNLDIPGLDLSNQTDSTITIMFNSSSPNVYLMTNQTPTVGSIPVGEPALSYITRCGSTASNNGCNRTSAVPTINNIGLKIMAFTLNTIDILASKITILPNPSHDFLTVSNQGNEDLYHFEVLDCNGRVILEQKKEALNFNRFDISRFANGVYLLKIFSNIGVITKKIIKN